MWSRKEVALGVLALAAVPALLTCVDPGWLFAPPGIDSWVYLGFFRHFPEFQAETFPGTYYGSRLSWVLPGYYAHQLLPPVTASCVLHLGVHLIGVLSLFEALRHTTSPRAAFVTALLLAGHGPFLESVGWDYVDGIGTAYYLLTWAFLVRAARSATPRLWLFGVGVGAAAAIYSNITWLPLLGLTLPGYAALHRRWHGRVSLSNIDTQMVMMVCGAGALTAGLGLANQHAGGSLLFYRPSIEFALSAAGKDNPWRMPLATWLPIAFWLVWPACAAIGSTVYLVRRQFRTTEALDAPASGWWPVNFLLVAALFLAATVRGQPLLQLSFYASYLIGPLMLACGTLLAAPLARLSRAGFWAAGGLVAGSAVLSAAKVASPPPLVWALACALAGCVGLGYQPGARWVVLACVGLLAAGSAVLPSTEATYTRLGWNIPLFHTRSRAALYSRVTTAARYVDEIARARRAESGRAKVWYWYDATEPLGPQHMSLASLWLWGDSLIDDRFPTWKRPNGGKLSPGDLVVVPSQRSDVVARALESWRDEEFALRLLESRPVGDGENQMTLAVFALDPRR